MKKLMIASDIHGVASCCRTLFERFEEEKADRLCGPPGFGRYRCGCCNACSDDHWCMQAQCGTAGNCANAELCGKTDGGKFHIEAALQRRVQSGTDRTDSSGFGNDPCGAGAADPNHRAAAPPGNRTVILG